MRLRMFCAMAAMVVCSAAFARDAAQDEREIRRIDAAICAEFESGDATGLKQNLDARFTLTSSRGEVTDLKQNLDEVAKREPRYEEFRNHDQNVRLYGDAAIVTGVTSIKGTADSQPFSADFQFTDTYVHRNGRWLLAASHASRLQHQ